MIVSGAGSGLFYNLIIIFFCVANTRATATGWMYNRLSPSQSGAAGPSFGQHHHNSFNQSYNNNTSWNSSLNNNNNNSGMQQSQSSTPFTSPYKNYGKNEIITEERELQKYLK